MKRIIDVPIESLEDRYSADWQKWFADEYRKAKVKWSRINPKPLTYMIHHGSFLDVCGTNFYKSEQARIISHIMSYGKFTDDDVFLFHDLWHPGLISLAYMRDALGLRFKIVGCLHAGSYDRYDFLYKKNMDYWAEPFENAILTIADKIFVATAFHKNMLIERRDVAAKKIIVTYFPIYDKHTFKFFREKQNIVIFPHRLDSEKQPDLCRHVFNQVEKRLTPDDGDWKFIFSKDVCATKEEYYQALSNSKISVSFALQETWGIAMLESLFAGCIPIVPYRLSYKEMYDSSCTYKSTEMAIEKILQAIRRPSQYLDICENIIETHLNSGKQAIPKMISECMGEDYVD